MMYVVYASVTKGALAIDVISLLCKYDLRKGDLFVLS